MSVPLIYLVVYLILAILHCVGLILLCKAENKIPNQRLLTKNLAVVEMLFCFNLVVYFSLLLNGKNAPILKYVTSTDTVFFTEIRLSMLHLIFDRFFEIYTNIKYPVYMPLKKVLLLVAIH